MYSPRVVRTYGVDAQIIRLFYGPLTIQLGAIALLGCIVACA